MHEQLVFAWEKKSCCAEFTDDQLPQGEKSAPALENAVVIFGWIGFLIMIAGGIFYIAQLAY